MEVKGLSGSEIIVEITPKEYAAMKLAMTGGFSEGEYKPHGTGGDQCQPKREIRKRAQAR
jgi:hypothetical protein